MCLMDFPQHHLKKNIKHMEHHVYFCWHESQQGQIKTVKR